MEIFFQKQFLTILYSLILGLIFGAGYDIMRIIHLMLEHTWLRQPLVFLTDLVYMLALSGCYSVFIYAFNNGRHRLFLAIPMALGFTAYYQTIGRVVIFFSEAIIRFLRMVFHYTVALPVSFLFSLLWRMVRWLARHTAGALLRGGRRLLGLWYTARQKRLLKERVRL